MANPAEKHPQLGGGKGREASLGSGLHLACALCLSCGHRQVEPDSALYFAEVRLMNVTRRSKINLSQVSPVPDLMGKIIQSFPTDGVWA